MLNTLVALLFLAVPSPQAPTATAVFDQGIAWADYVATTKQQHDIWVKNAARDVSPALVERLKKVGAGLKLSLIHI